MNYEKTEWKDLPDTSTPITSSRLNNMEDGIEYLFNNGVGASLPVGSITQFAGSTAPSGFLICDGSAVSRTTFESLFNVLGVAYGEGDGSTTFNLPNLKGKIPVGYDGNDTDFNTLGNTGGEKEHTLTTNELPSHSHRQLYASNPTSGSWGRDISGVNYNVISSPINFYNGIFSGETGENQAHNIMQPYVVVNYIIKY
jgi:microcystin-dependent protein